MPEKPPVIPVIIVSKDCMQALLNFADGNDMEANEQPRELSVPDLEQALKQAGVLLSPPEGLLQDLVNKHNRGQDIQGTVVVSGMPPRMAAGEQFSAFGNLRLPVFPGDQIGQITPPVSSRSGMDVFGKTIPAVQNNLPEQPLSILSDQLQKDDDGIITARQYGLVTMENRELNFTPLLQLSPDAMSLSGTIFPRDFKSEPVSEEKLISAIKAMNLKARINGAIFEAALTKVLETDQTLPNVILCTGLKPVKGENGSMEILVRQRRPKLPGTMDSAGNIDYKQRGSIDTVKKGQPLARIQPPGKGRPGRNLLGEKIAPEPGDPYPVNLGEHVVQHGNDIVATYDGLLSYTDDEIRVSDVYVVDGDVGPYTGHVALERGSVQVEGTVLAGFHVNCPVNILVKGTVEDCMLMAGQDIDVDGGIVMNGNGMLRAGGSVRALFAIGSNIRVGRNLYITNEISKSEVVAEGGIIVSGGQGKVIGGRLTCGGGIQATQVGSELGVPTQIRLDLFDILAEYKRERERLEQTLQHIRQKLGDADDKTLLARFAQHKQKQATVQHILNLRNRLANDLEKLNANIARLEMPPTRNHSAVLKVYGTIYPGTSIHYSKKSLQVRNQISKSKILYDFAESKFQVLGI